MCARGLLARGSWLGRFAVGRECHAPLVFRAVCRRRAAALAAEDGVELARRAESRTLGNVGNGERCAQQKGLRMGNAALREIDGRLDPEFALE